MTPFRILNVQGIAGIAASAALAMLLIFAKLDGHRLRGQAATFERLYRAEVSAHAADVEAVRAAAQKAQDEDRANATRVARAQLDISERTANDFESRVADARARARAHAQRLRAPSGDGAASNSVGQPHLPGLPAAARSADQAAGEGRLPDADALIATEQAIQLDELIKWVRAQAAIDPTASSPRR